MAFAEHPNFQPPADREATIWRYMDLAKFLSLLDRSSLYFPRVDHLAAGDPFEGYYTKLNARIGKLTYTDVAPELLKEMKLEDEATFNAVWEFHRQSGRLAKAMRETTYVNSWHVLNHESAAMWTLYLKSADGIAVQSTYKRLLDSFSAYKEFEIHVGLIQYIDYEREAIPPGQAFYPIMHKRKSFEHEHELRAVIWTVEGNKNQLPIQNPDVNRFKDIPGLYVPVELSTLIKAIYVAPSAPKWIVDLLNSLVKRYSLDKPIVHSELAASPLE